MKNLFLLLIASLSMSLHASAPKDPSDVLGEEVLKLVGKEDLEEFEFVSDFLFNKEIASSEKRRVLLPVLQRPSDYPSDLILVSAGVFLVLRDYEKASFLYAKGIQDPLVDQEIISFFEKEARLSPKESKVWEKAKKKALR